MKKLCVLGLGYIGLPTAALFATHGIAVHGMDINLDIVKTVQRREVHIEEPGLKTVVVQALETGQLTVSNKVEPADFFIIAVPTPSKKDEYGEFEGKKYKLSDMQAVTSAAESIVPFLNRGNLVILESTSPVRTTVDLIKPILEKSGLKTGSDFYLAYSPERVLPGQILKELVDNSRVIGGIDRGSAERGRELYSAFVKGEIILTDSTTAEMVKLMENTYRDVNIAIANEFTLLAERFGVNVWEAIEIANLHPRVKILKPGPGVGGHCIAIDPLFFVEAAPDITNVIYSSRARNDQMPKFVVEKVMDIVKDIKNPIIACLGLTYKADVNDTRESPALEIIEKLCVFGYQVRAFDPFVKSLPILVCELTSSLTEALKDADLLILLVDHKLFKELTPEILSNMRRRRIFDTRNIFRASIWNQTANEIFYLGAPKLK